MAFKDKGRYHTEEYKEYQRNYQRAWHQRNKEKRLAKMYTKKAALYEYVQDIKSRQCCADCGQQHPATLQFHHLNSDIKEFNISDAVRMGTSPEKIKAEIDKCIVLCANCHIIRHYNMRPKKQISPEVAEELEKITRHLTSSLEDAEASDD